MYRLSAVIGGVVGGAIGAAVWAGIAYVTGYEIGWIAWGIGAVVGFGVALGNKGEGGVPAGVLAAVIAVMSVVGGKYATVKLVLSNETDIVESFVAGLEDEELVVSYIADEVAAEFEVEGKPVAWPEGVEPSVASTEAEYPADVWQIAQARWDGMSQQEHDEFRAELEDMMRANIAEAMPEIQDALLQGGFLASFGAMDLVFFGLAVLTAFKIGAAGKQEEGVAVAEPVEAGESPHP